MPGQLCHEEDGNSCLHNGSLVLEWAKSGKSVNESNKKKQRNTHTDTQAHTHTYKHMLEVVEPEMSHY